MTLVQDVERVCGYFRFHEGLGIIAGMGAVLYFLMFCVRSWRTNKGYRVLRRRWWRLAHLGGLVLFLAVTWHGYNTAVATLREPAVAGASQVVRLAEMQGIGGNNRGQMLLTTVEKVCSVSLRDSPAIFSLLPTLLALKTAGYAPEFRDEVSFVVLVSVVQVLSFSAILVLSIYGFGWFWVPSGGLDEILKGQDTNADGLSQEELDEVQRKNLLLARRAIIVALPLSLLAALYDCIGR